MKPFSREQRSANLSRANRGEFDLVVIGGGINGAAVARDAALRGYRVALLEQYDFGWGTSSRSSRLIHGGLRYLEHGELGLVLESVRERALLARAARHLLRPLPFIVPVYEHDGWPLALVDLGVWIYETLALFRSPHLHERLSPRALCRRVPGLSAEGLAGGVLYYDYQTNDARLVFENVLSAHEAGACVLSYCRVDELELVSRRARAVLARDLLGGEAVRVRGHAFVCAVGPWTDAVLSRTSAHRRWLRPTKGVHVVVPREKLSVDAALVMRHPRDGRALFVLPEGERTVIGTTDTDFQGDPAHAETEADDVRYLLAAASHFFPRARLTSDDVIANWCGVRPLLDDDDTGSPSAVSRDHRVVVGEDGIVVLAGGKLTTHRSMAAECVDAAATAIGLGGGQAAPRRAGTHLHALPGAVGLSSEAAYRELRAALRAAFARDAAIGAHLATSYGVRARGVLDIALTEPGAHRPIIAGLPFIWSEVQFAARHEMALTLEDAFVRRIPLFQRAQDQGLSVAEEAARLMGEHLRWNSAECDRQVQHYVRKVEQSRAWRNQARADSDVGSPITVAR